MPWSSLFASQSNLVSKPAKVAPAAFIPVFPARLADGVGVVLVDLARGAVLLVDLTKFVHGVHRFLRALGESLGHAGDLGDEFGLVPVAGHQEYSPDWLRPSGDRG